MLRGGADGCAKLSRMFPDEYDASPGEVRRFVALQVVITAGFVVVLFFALGGADDARPPWWVMLLMIAPVGVAAFFAERVWMDAPALDPAESVEEQRRRGVAVYAAHTVRRLAICQAPVIISVLVTFIGPWGAWSLVVGAVPGIALLAFEATPSLRTTTLTEVVLDADGAESGLVEQFAER